MGEDDKSENDFDIAKTYLVHPYSLTGLLFKSHSTNNYNTSCN